jgi:hypothetical protein
VTECIAECAEAILKELGKMPEINILRLSEQLGERSTLTYQALGWLAREGRIRYTQRGSQVFVSLSETCAMEG